MPFASSIQPLIAMDHLHPMTDIKRTLSDYLYAFRISGNTHRHDQSNQSVRDEFRVAERSKKRTHTSSSSSATDRSAHSAGYDKGKSSKKTESGSTPDRSSVPLGHKRE